MGISGRQNYEPLRKKVVNGSSQKKVFNPQDDFLEVWNKMFLVCCFFALACDPLLFYVPYLDAKRNCMDIERDVAMITTMIRTILDAFYCIRIFFQFQTAFVSPSSRVFGRGEFVTDSAQIAKHYFRGLFFIDLLSILPLPQYAIWRFLTTNNVVLNIKSILLSIVLVQYIPRFLRLFPLASELNKSAGIFVQSVLFGVICYLMLFVLSSHILGAVWYLLALHRNFICWEKTCTASDICKVSSLFCSSLDKMNRKSVPLPWTNISEAVLSNSCSMKNDDNLSLDVVKFGIYKQALESDIFSKDNFSSKLVYCVWWGLQNLSTLGQGLEPSMNPEEISFTVSVAVFGLVFFGLLIGNVQIYLQSLSVKMDETRIQRRSAEEWMQHRAVPQDMKDRFRRYEQYKWIETRGADEESLVESLPTDLKKDVRRHLCHPFVRRVPLLANIDDRFLDAICERLKPTFYIENSCILRHGDPVEEILLIVRGQLESVAKNGGEIGSDHLSVLKEGDVVGDELLAWPHNPVSGSTLPLSTQRIQTLTEVEAFVLSSENIKFLSSQFRHLYSRQFQHISRYYSQQWRTWQHVIYNQLGGDIQ